MGLKLLFVFRLLASIAAPIATPESPLAGWTNISLNIFFAAIFPLREQFNPTPPDIQRLLTLYFF